MGFRDFSRRLGKSHIGRSIQMGAAESLGVVYKGQTFGTKAVSEGFMGLKGGASFGKALPGVLGLGFTAIMAHEGYQQQGVWGATKGVAESALWSALPRLAGGLINPGTMAVGAVAALGYGAYQLGEAGKAHHKRLRDVEMSVMSPDVFNSHGAATMRQRSVMALQNTHINGRMAMGNEGMIMHTPFRL